jgi:hypothetical protein
MSVASISNKELKKVAKQAVKRGWIVDRESNSGHLTLRHGEHPHHRITVASSPSDRNAYKHMQRRILRCEAGRCEHGTPAAISKPKARPIRKEPKMNAIIYTPPSKDDKKVVAGPEPTMTTKEVAEYYGVTTGRVLQMGKAGILQIAVKGKKGDKHSPTRYTVSSVEAYERKRKKDNRVKAVAAKKAKSRKQEADAAATAAVNEATRPAAKASGDYRIRQVAEQAKPAGRVYDGADIILARMEGYAANDGVMSMMIVELRQALGREMDPHAAS